jgi:heavy metal sensor kinase
MKSIRLSLILFILLLQGLALGAVVGLLYRTTASTLAEKDINAYKNARNEYETRREATKNALQNQILERARELSAIAQSEWAENNLEMQASWAAQASGSLTGGVFWPAAWLATGPGGPVAPYWRRRFLVRLRGAEDIVARQSEPEQTDYFQIYNEDGQPVQKSASLGEWWTLGSQFKDAPLSKPEYDDVELEGGVLARRVTLKAQVSRVRRSGRQMLDGRDASRGSSIRTGARSPWDQSYWTVPTFYIQYARDASLRDQAIANYEKSLQFDLQQVEIESEARMASLRRWVIGVGLGAFVISTAGACWLIAVGLAPLQRLTDAVSRVSPKDFRLPYDPVPTPQELRPIYDRLTQTLGQLERAFAREKQATADISHELRTPLTALLTTLDVALLRPRTPEQYADLLQECRSIGRQLSLLVERLLALARIDAGADSVRPQEVDVTALAAQCVALVQPLADARDLAVELHAPAPVKLITDPNKLREIITNLLHNAIEYNKPHGRIDVSVDRRNGHMHLQVRDTGIGISPKVVGHIFERFYRVDESRQADSLHAGLGLAIVKSYLEVLGGTIQVSTSEGEGSTFRVEMPITG